MDVSLELAQELFPEYSIAELVDSGRSSHVYRGVWDDQDIVVKIIPIESRHRLRRAEREARAMELVDSSNFVQLVEHFVDELPEEGTTFFVIVEEFIPGDSLQSLIDRGEPSVDLGMRVVKSLLEVLVDFEQAGLIHRDIKPSNIIVGEDGVKLLDAGIVRFLGDESLTADDADYGPGTRGYRAPEQIQNRKHLQDIRTDLFATGIVMFESITGEHPFEHDNTETAKAILQGQRKDLTDFVDRPDLDYFYKRLTSVEQHERFRKPSFALDELRLIMPQDANGGGIDV